MRHFLSSIALAATIGLGAPAAGWAQNLFQPVVYVNDGAVTRYEIDQRVRFMRLLGAPNTTAAEAEEELINDRLRLYAARLRGIEASDESVQRGLEEFASRAGMSADEFTQALAQSGIERQVFRDFVSAGIVWRGVVGQTVLPMVDVSDAEIDQELKRRIETPIITRVLLSELIIPAPEGQEGQAMEIATGIARSNPSSAQFASAAQQYSAAPSAEAGGRLEWVNLDNLPPTLRPVILSMTPGQTSQPLTVPGAVVLFHMRDQAGMLRPGAREQVLDYMTLRMGSASEAAALAARLRYCNDLYLQVSPEASAQIQRQTLSQNQIPTLVATQLASMDPDEASVVNYGNAADLVMLCSRQPALLASGSGDDDIAVTAEAPDGVEAAVPSPDGLPDRESVRSELFNRKANAAADAYLAELRADAVIRRP